MNLWRKVLIGGGIAAIGSFLGYYLWKEYNLVKNWDFFVNKITLKDFSTASSTLMLTIRIVNVSDVEATIANLNASVYINNVFMGTIFQPDSMVIPSQGYNLLYLNVQLDNSNVLNNFAAIGAQGVDAPVVIHTVGTLRISSGFLWATVTVDDTENYTFANLLFS